MVCLLPILLWINLAKSLDAGRVPEIPAGRRAQYYFLYDDGGYKYGYDTGTGSSATAVADPANNVRGGFAYPGPTGVLAFTYTADAQGYKPQIVQGGGGLQDFNTDGMGGATGRSGLEASAHSADGGGQGGGWTETEEPPSGDASYSFGFSTPEQSRHEVSDALGNVQGSYYYLSDGTRRQFDYEAGIGKGFVVKANQVPTINDGSYSFAYDAADHSRQEFRDSRGNFKTMYSFVSTPAGGVGDLSGGGGYAPFLGSAPDDGSYSFSYDAGDQSRQEVGDAQRNVIGSFSYVAEDDGIRRKVDYEAGAEKGFVARGQHLPSSIFSKAGGSGYMFPVADSVHTLNPLLTAPNAGGHAFFYDLGPPAERPSPVAVNLAEIQSGGPLRADGSYSFAYETDTQSRSEEADPSGNVRGSFTFVAKDDGLRRRVDYEAGAKKGFSAKGAHLPESATASPRTTNVPPIVSRGGGYSFGFESEDQSRREAGDSRGNVRGSFSYFSRDDGKVRKVDYRAGAEEGFVAKGDHLPSTLAPPPARGSFSYADSPNFKTGTASDAPNDDRGQVSLAEDEENRTATEAEGDLTTVTPAPEEETTAYDLETSERGDAAAAVAYSYSYETDSSKKHESSDGTGKVVGGYSYEGPDGITRNIQYIADPKKGFRVKADYSPNKSPTTTTHKPRVTISPNSPEAQALIKLFLTPNDHHKFGYVYDSYASKTNKA